jgi:methylase of polypeptide subunit release factors
MGTVEGNERIMSSSERLTDDGLPDPAELSVSNPPWVSAAYDDARAFARVVVERVRPGQRVLDLGTGTGILAIALAKVGIDVVATDISAAAIRNARENAVRNGVRFECCQSDLLDSVEGRFDLIAFNPPYNVRPDSFASNVVKNLVRRIPWVQRNCGPVMPQAVLRFHQQLVRRIAEKAPQHLNPGGYVILHAFPSEVAALSEILPPDFEVQVVDHPWLRPYGTVGMLMLSPQ